MSWTAFGEMAHLQPSSSHPISSQCVSPNMPAISEDDVIAIVDEPAEKYFAKSIPSRPVRRESLLTTALHTDSESHDESSAPRGYHAFGRMMSRSSTCSTWSAHTDLTSDDGQPHSPSRSSSGVNRKPGLSFFRNMLSGNTDNNDAKAQPKDQADGRKSISDSSEPAIETALGRKRCISFRCGAAKDKPAEAKPQDAPAPPAAEAETKPGPLKRICSLRFECPTRTSASSTGTKEAQPAPRPARRLSPPPALLSSQTPSPSSTRRSHRDSDSTIKNESPKSVRSKPASIRGRPAFRDYDDISPSDATKFHEFASSADDPEDWVQEQTVHRSRLTVNDTLRRENEIRNLGEEAEEEALDDDDDEADDYDDDLLSDDDEDDDISDGGFQTDDEKGFAESDDESDDGSDYEWWAPRRIDAKSPGTANLLPVHIQRPRRHRKLSQDTTASGSSAASCGEVSRPLRRTTLPLPIRPGTPELPDSTDFVCGTLDEDRPLERAYASCMEQRKMAKHRAVPQDIDPTFPTSDHEIDSDNGDDEAAAVVEESDSQFLGGGFEDLHGNGTYAPGKRTSPLRSPKRFRSPVPTKRKPSPAPVKQRRPSPAPVSRRSVTPAPISKRSPTPPRGRSRTPHLLFEHSPIRGRSPPSSTRLISPPPSRRGSTVNMHQQSDAFGTTLLASRPQLTHTASLPRSVNVFGARLPSARTESRRIGLSSKDNSDDEGEPTERDEPYSRGAIDIKQGLERKRLRRRQKFHEKYLKKEERKMQRGEKPKRPQPGKGAQRMRQIGIECAIYRGKRVESL